MKTPGILVLVALAGFAVLGLGAATGYLQPTVLGALPSGARLEAISHSPNYVDSAFRNQIKMPMRTTDQSEWAMWVETIFEPESHARPPEIVPSIKTNLKELERAQDLVIWLGHSSYYVQLNGQRILIDPVLSSNASPIPFTNTAFEGTSIYSAEDMADMDFLLISHDHYDHLDYPTAAALKAKVRQVVVGLGVGAHFEKWGYDMRSVSEVDWNQSGSSAPGLQILVAPARHFSGRGFTRDQSLWVGFALISPSRRLYFSGDSGYAEHFAEIGRTLGPFDWMTLDTGQYDPRWANVHMSPEQAAQAAQDLRTKVLVPRHVGRFSLAPHAWDDPYKRLAVASQNRGYDLWTPKIGQPMFLDGEQRSFPSWW